jgi:hypothetical protein
VDLDQLTPDLALQLIGRLKQGKNVIFGANLFSVGRDMWVRGAEQVFQDIEQTHDSVVRFIRGDYGVGKTNFAARLFYHALRRGWLAAYVEISDQVKFHEFHQVFSEIVNKTYAPEQLGPGGSNSLQPFGLMGVLDHHFRKVRKAVGLGPGADVSASARRDVLTRIETVLQTNRIYGDFAAAARAYFEARMDDDKATVELLARWFRADQDIKLPQRGVMKPISKIRGKEHLRSLSAMVAGLGYKGMLIIIDELEAIMEETTTRRRKAYTILRELMDNVDGENGMKNTCFYAAAPPGQFESQKGFIEVEPLASRIQAPIAVSSPGDIDYTSTIVDLDAAPLTSAEQLELARRLTQIHGVARSWNASQALSETSLAELVKLINAKRRYSNIRIREFCIEVISALERKHAVRAAAASGIADD